MIYPHDPEGIFSTLPAFFTTYIGYYFCLIMKDNKTDVKRTLKQWFIISFILGLSVYPLTKMMPLNKKMYSASFAVLSACVAGAAIIVFILLVDVYPSSVYLREELWMFALLRSYGWEETHYLFMFLVSWFLRHWKSILKLMDNQWILSLRNTGSILGLGTSKLVLNSSP